MTADAAHLVTRLRAAGCVWAEDEASLLLGEGFDADELEHRIRRRVAGEPLETVLGWALFRGIRVRVAPGVFVPRPRSAFLVDVALTRMRTGARVADVCCGSGALAAAVVAARPDALLVASDIDPVAVALARRNLPGIRVEVGDLLDALPPELRGALDVVMANVPYVPAEEVRLLPPEARDHEPLATLDGGGDGLEVLRGVAAEAADWLAPGGTLLCEIAAIQAPAAERGMRSAGLAPEIRYSDEWDTTVVLGRRAD